MPEVTYQNKRYRRVGSKWVDASHMVVHESLQQILNDLYIQTIDLSAYSIEELIAEGDRFKESGSYREAIAFYEKAAHECDIETIRYILPRITACYRKARMAKKAIDLFVFAKAKFGSAYLSSVLLTSVAAAYCDLMEYENALKCCKRAYAMENGRADSELHAVFGRIKKESGLE